MSILYANSGGTSTAASQPVDSDSLALSNVLNNGIDYESTANAPSMIKVAITGLTAGQQYAVDLIWSSEGNATRTQSVQYNTAPAVNGTTFSTSAAIDTQTSVAHLAYDFNDTVTAVGGDITAYLYNNASNAVFSGVVVSSVVPEPASVGLLALGGAGLLLRRRRRHAGKN